MDCTYTAYCYCSTLVCMIMKVAQAYLRCRLLIWVQYHSAGILLHLLGCQAWSSFINSAAVVYVEVAHVKEDRLSCRWHPVSCHRASQGVHERGECQECQTVSKTIMTNVREGEP